MRPAVRGVRCGVQGCTRGGLYRGGEGYYPADIALDGQTLGILAVSHRNVHTGSPRHAPRVTWHPPTPQGKLGLDPWNLTEIV